MAKLVKEVEERVRREEVQKIAGTRLWVSEEFQPVLNAPTIVEHGLDIDPLKCKCDVLLKCIVADNDYLPGDLLGGWSICSYLNSHYDFHAPQPSLSSKNILLNSSQGISALRKSGNRFGIAMANWRYIFRIWY